MKIIDFISYYPPHIGGLENYEEELLHNLTGQGCQITVFTSHLPKSAPASEITNGVEIIRYPCWEIISNFPVPKFWQPTFWHQWRTILNHDYDLAFSSVRFFPQPLLAHWFCRKKNIPRLHIEHGSDFVSSTWFISLVARIYDYTLGYAAVAWADKIITPSESAAKFVKLLTNRDATVIYRGMPFAKIDAILPNYRLKEKYSGKIIVTFVGRLFFGKGVVHLLETARDLERDDVVFLILGDGPEMKNLRTFVKENNLHGKVVFLGSVTYDKVIGILKVSDICVNPSYNEGLPTSVLEAGICQTTILATRVGGTPEIVTDQQSALLIQPYSSQAITAGIEQILTDTNMSQRLANSARVEIERRFNWHTSINCFIREIEDMLQKSYD